MTVDELIALKNYQLEWIKLHGGDKVGYIENYGNPHLEKCHGEGGVAIYNADIAELQRIEKMLKEKRGY